jgi:hypothetical protein
MARYVADGTVIARGNGASPEVFTNIPQVLNMGSVGQTRSLIDITNLASDAREYLKAIKDGQEMTLIFQYDPDDSTHAALRTDANAETPVNFRITLTNSPAQTIDFAAQVMSFSITNIEIDNVLGYEVALKPTGDLVFA